MLSRYIKLIAMSSILTLMQPHLVMAGWPNAFVILQPNALNSIVNRVSEDESGKNTSKFDGIPVKLKLPMHNNWEKVEVYKDKTRNEYWATIWYNDKIMSASGSRTDIAEKDTKIVVSSIIKDLKQQGVDIIKDKVIITVDASIKVSELNGVSMMGSAGYSYLSNIISFEREQ